MAGKNKPNNVNEANEFLINYMEEVLKDGRSKVGDIWNKFNYTYWVIVVLSICMFIIGIALLSFSGWLLVSDRTESLNWLAMAGLGLVDIITLFLFKPVSKLQDLMGDMGQMTITLNGYQTQKALILLGSDLEERATMTLAAADVGRVSQQSISLIETYFEIQQEENQPAKTKEDTRATNKHTEEEADSQTLDLVLKNGQMPLAAGTA